MRKRSLALVGLVLHGACPAGGPGLGSAPGRRYLTRLAFEIDWGYLRKGAMRVVVSLGFGTRGPLIRIGKRPKHALGHEKRLHGALTADMVMTLRAPSSGCMAYSPGRQRPLVKPILSRNLVAGGTQVIPAHADGMQPGAGPVRQTRAAVFLLPMNKRLHGGSPEPAAACSSARAGLFPTRAVVLCMADPGDRGHARWVSGRITWDG